jgi:periplasmic divalent cation tolerance protein
VALAESIYRWQGGIVTEPEILLLIKTRGGTLPPLRAWITAHHPYEVPEILVARMDDADPRYLAWLLGATQPTPKEEER